MHPHVIATSACMRVCVCEIPTTDALVRRSSRMGAHGTDNGRALGSLWGDDCTFPRAHTRSLPATVAVFSCTLHPPLLSARGTASSRANVYIHRHALVSLEYK